MSELARVRRAAAARRRAEEAYRQAVVDAIAELEAAGVRDAYAQVAHAAGVSRQAVRQLMQRTL
jgi:hypothetical protein